MELASLYCTAWSRQAPTAIKHSQCLCAAWQSKKHACKNQMCSTDIQGMDAKAHRLWGCFSFPSAFPKKYGLFQVSSIPPWCPFTFPPPSGMWCLSALINMAGRKPDRDWLSLLAGPKSFEMWVVNALCLHFLGTSALNRFSSPPPFKHRRVKTKGYLRNCQKPYLKIFPLSVGWRPPSPASYTSLVHLSSVTSAASQTLFIWQERSLFIILPPDLSFGNETVLSMQWHYLGFLQHTW